MTTSKKIRTTIIIVNYNSWDHLLECLPSLWHSISDLDEVIVVDNASPENYLEEFQLKFPWVHWYQTESNLGFGGANNFAAEYARGEYLAFLNPDTVVDPRWLEWLIIGFRQYADVGMVTSKILIKNHPKQINTCGNNVHISGLTLCRGLGEGFTNYLKDEIVNAASGCAFLMERALFEKLNGFDARFFLYLEDTDLSVRVQLTGKKIRYIARSVVFHDYQLNFNREKIYLLERNRYWLLRKNFSRKIMFQLLPVLIFSEIVTWGYILLKDRSRWKQKVKAYKDWNPPGKRTRSSELMQMKLINQWGTKLSFEQLSSSLVSFIAHNVFDPIFTILNGFRFYSTRRQYENRPRLFSRRTFYRNAANSRSVRRP